MLPKKIVHYWHSEDNAGLVSGTLATWRTLYPDFETVLFNDESALAYLREKTASGAEFAQGVLDAYTHCYLPAMKSDIFRAYYTFSDGGLYVDAPTAATNRLDELVPADTELVLYRRWHGGINNGLFWAPAGSPFLRDFLNIMLERVDMKASNDIYTVTGPGIWTKLARAYQNGPIRMLVLKHEDIAKKFVRFNQSLPYKSDGTHWSAMQNRESIFRTYHGPSKRLIIHLGVHKTASTLIQLALNSAEDQLTRNGTAVFSAHSKTSPAYRPFRNSFQALGKHLLKAAQKDPAALETSQQLFTLPLFKKARLAFDQLMRDTPQETVIISDENLLGPPIGEYVMARELRITRFYEAAAVIASSLASITREHHTTLIIYRRNEVSLIESLYGNAISNLRFEGTIEEFLESIDWKSIDFGRLAAQLGASFEGNLRMGEFELIKQGSDVFMADFMKRAGLPPLSLSRSLPVVNSRPSDAQVLEARRLAARTLSHAQRLEAMRRVNRHTQKDAAYTLTRLPPHLRSEIEQHFAKAATSAAAAVPPGRKAPAASKAAGPVVGIVGNGQARPLAMILRTLVPGIAPPKVVVGQLASDQDADETLETLRRCDIVLAQGISEDGSAKFTRMETLRREIGGKVISWPNISYKGQCPDICSVRLPSGARLLGPLGEFQSSVSLSAWSKGRPASDVVRAYRTGGDLIEDLASVPTSSLQDLVERERTSDTKISDYIAEMWQREVLFFTFNRPKLKLLQLVTERLIEAAGIPRPPVFFSHNLNEPMGQIAPGRYPAMIELLGLQLPRKPWLKGKEIELGKTVKFGGQPKYYRLEAWVDLSFRCLDLQFEANAEKALSIT